MPKKQSQLPQTEESKLDVIIALMIAILQKDGDLSENMQKRLIKNLKNAGFGYNQITKLLGIGKSTISKSLKK